MRKRFIAMAVALTVAMVGLVSCSNEEETNNKHKYESVVEGKVFSVSYFSEKTSGEDEEKYSEEEMAAFDKNAETALADGLSFLSAEHNSSVADINKQVDYIFDADAEILGVLSKAYELSSFTEGNFKPVLGDIDEYSCSAIIEIAEDKLIKHVKNAELDLSGISESYALSFAVDSLKESGIKEAVLKYGNTIARIDEKAEKTPVEIALYFADGNFEQDGSIMLSSGYVSTCTKNEEVKDLQTNEEITPLHNTVAVISEDAFVSGCLAKAFRGMETEKIKELYSEGTFKFEVIIVEEDGTVVCTQGADTDELFVQDTEEEK